MPFSLSPLFIAAIEEENQSNSERKRVLCVCESESLITIIPLHNSAPNTHTGKRYELLRGNS